MSSSNIEQKKHMIRRLLKQIYIKKKAHYNLFKKYKRYSTLSSTLVNCLGACSVSSIIVSMSGNKAALIVSLSCTSVSSIINVIASSMGFDERYHSHQTTHLQYSDLFRDTNNRLLRNHLSSEDLDCMLSDLNNRLGLVEDVSSPIDIPRRLNGSGSSSSSSSSTAKDVILVINK